MKAGDKVRCIDAGEKCGRKGPLFLQKGGVYTIELIIYHGSRKKPLLRLQGVNDDGEPLTWSPARFEIVTDEPAPLPSIAESIEAIKQAGLRLP